VDGDTTTKNVSSSKIGDDIGCLGVPTLL